MKALLLVFLLASVACVKKEESSSVLSAPGSADYGVYSRCDNEGGMSIKVVMYYNQKSLNGSFTLHSGANCLAPNALAVMKDIYSYTNVGSVFTLTVESMTMTPIDASTVNLLNGNTSGGSNPCGSYNWVQNTPKDMFGCDGYDINRGDVHTINLFKDGSSLVMKEDGVKTKYARLHSINYAPQSQTLANGSYTYYDGSRAIHLTVTSPNFTMKVFDDATSKFYVKTGSFSSANNVAAFNITNTTPSCGSNGILNYKFFQSGSNLLIDGLEGTDWLLEKTPNTASQFEAAFLTGTQVSGCF